MGEISKITIDLIPLVVETLGTQRRLSKDQKLQLMEKALLFNYPKKFTYRDRKTKLLELALAVYTDHIIGKAPGSNSEYATRLGWKGCQGKISSMFRQLEKMGFTIGKEFDERFLSKLYQRTLLKLLHTEEVLEDIKLLFSSYPSQHFNLKTVVAQGFRFTAGQFMGALLSLFDEAAEGEEAYLLLKEGRTWASQGIGDFMKFFLTRTVTEKKIKLRVMTTSLMQKELYCFFEDLGEILKDDTLLDFLGDLRYFYISGYIITVVKSVAGTEREIIFSGNVKKDHFNEREKIKEIFEEGLARIR